MAAFFMSCYGGIYIVSLPFVIASLGGTDKDLGLCASMGFMSYLVGCITTGSLLDRFDSKRLAQLGSGVVSISIAALLMIVLLNIRGYSLSNPVLLVIITAMISGLLTSIYWPPIMGWLSTGQKGRDLNRRLGIYNVSWSAGLAVSPFFGRLAYRVKHCNGIVCSHSICCIGFCSSNSCPSTGNSRGKAKQQ